MLITYDLCQWPAKALLLLLAGGLEPDAQGPKASLLCGAYVSACHDNQDIASGVRMRLRYMLTLVSRGRSAVRDQPSHIRMWPGAPGGSVLVNMKPFAPLPLHAYVVAFR